MHGDANLGQHESVSGKILRHTNILKAHYQATGAKVLLLLTIQIVVYTSAY